MNIVRCCNCRFNHVDTIYLLKTSHSVSLLLMLTEKYPHSRILCAPSLYQEETPPPVRQAESETFADM